MWCFACSSAGTVRVPLLPMLVGAHGNDFPRRTSVIRRRQSVRCRIRKASIHCATPICSPHASAVIRLCTARADGMVRTPWGPLGNWHASYPVAKTPPLRSYLLCLHKTNGELPAAPRR